MRFSILATLPLIALAGCAKESRQAPLFIALGGMGTASTEAEPANSPPRGSPVGEALTGPAGNIETARVGLATRGAARLAPAATSRH